MLKALRRSAISAVKMMLLALTIIGLIGGLRADVVQDDPDLNALVGFCGQAFRTVIRIVRNYPDGCVLGFVVFVVLHASVTRPGIEKQKRAFDNRREAAKERNRQRQNQAKKPVRRGRA